MPVFPSGSEKTILVDADKLPLADSESSDEFEFTSIGSIKTAVLDNVIFENSGTITSNSGGSYENDDFVFGSSQLDYDGGLANNSRMFFDKSKGAFRVGVNVDATWDAANVGSGSFAAGESTQASGVNSICLGGNTHAVGIAGIGIGVGVRSNDRSEIVLGNFNVESTGSSTAWVATDNLFVIGNGENDGSRNDALKMLKNGQIYLDDPKTPSAHPGNYKALYVNTDNGYLYSQDIGAIAFTDLTDSMASYTNSNALLKTNAAGNGVDESNILIDNVGADTLTFDIDSTKTITIAGALNIEADSVINQDLSSDATPTFAHLNISATNISYTGGTGQLAAATSFTVGSPVISLIAPTSITLGVPSTNLFMAGDTRLQGPLTFIDETEPAPVDDEAIAFLGNSGGNSASTTIILDHNDNTGTPQTWINEGLLGITMGVDFTGGPVNSPNQVTTQNRFGSGSSYYDGSNSEALEVTGLPTTSATDWTFQGWIWLPAGTATTEMHIFSAGDSTGDNYMDFYIKQNDFFFNLRQGGGWAVQLQSLGTEMTEQEWIHVAMTRLGDNFYMHVNGVMQVTDSWSGTVSGLDNYYAGWGGAANIDIYYTGYIDEFKYDVAALYGPGPFTPQDVAFDVKIPKIVLENGDIVSVGGSTGSSSGIIVHNTLSGIDGAGTYHVTQDMYNGIVLTTPVAHVVVANAVTIDLSASLSHHLDLNAATGVTAITMTNGVPGKTYTVRVTQGAGEYNATWGNGSETVKFPGGITPVITAIENKTDLFKIYCVVVDDYEATFDQNL